MMKVSETILLG